MSQALNVPFSSIPATGFFFASVLDETDFTVLEDVFFDFSPEDWLSFFTLVSDFNFSVFVFVFDFPARKEIIIVENDFV